MRPQASRALRLEYVTLGWNVVEGALALIAAGAATSVALLGFGLDSVVECLSAGVMIWRLRAERRGVDGEKLEAVENRARKLVAVSLFVLAAVVVLDSARALWMRERPEPTAPGIAVLVAAFIVMGFLAGAKRRAAKAIGSRAMVSDAFQTTTCMWLSATALVGLGANAALGWWWADPIAAVALTWFIVSEGREAWRGEDCCDDDRCVGVADSIRSAGTTDANA
ncbi:MAG: cation transporter [Kofleriaceae bacterium]